MRAARAEDDLPERAAAGSPVPHVLEPFDRQLSRFECRAFYAAALGSVLLHGAILWLPLGSANLGRDASSSAARSVIRALLRAEEPEPVRAPKPPVRAVEAPPPPAPESPRVEPKPAPPPGATRESKSVAAIPATFLDPSALTEKPRPLREPRLDLLTPILARAGLVHLVLYINEHGVVEDVQIDSATLPPAAVERAAAIFAAVPFSPGRIEGTAVRTRVRITVGAEERGKED